MTRILVTGASGFLGPYVIRALAARGLRAVALIRRGSDPSRLAGLPCEPRAGDVTERESVRAALESCDGVIHLAGKVAVRASESGECERVNVEGTRNVVEAFAGKKKGGRLVHLSSVITIGAMVTPDEGPPLNETSLARQCGPDFPNCLSKTRGEELVLEAVRRGAVDAVILNPSMIFGAGDARKAARRGSVLASRGKLRFYPRGGVSAVGAEDVAGAIVAALSKGIAGERYILSGENLTLRELLTTFAECAGARPPRMELPSSVLRGAARTLAALGLNAPLTIEGAIAATSYHWYDHSKAKATLGFQPRPAIEGILESVKWMRANGYL